MFEMSSTDEKGGSVPLNKFDDLNEKESSCRRKKMYIIIGVPVALVIILVVVLCVCLIKKSKKTYNNNITLKVYSDSDDKEISFISNEFNIAEEYIKKENITMLIDDSKNSFTKSKK